MAHGVDNLADLTVINEAEMLRHLKTRYNQRKIFTSIGDALLITNPYQEIPELFSVGVMKMYQNVYLSFLCRGAKLTGIGFSASSHLRHCNCSIQGYI